MIDTIRFDLREGISMFLGLDPLWLGLMFISIVLGGATQFYINSTFKKWSRVHSANGLTGAAVAETILSRNRISARVAGAEEGVHAVRVVQSRSGGLSDHYDPRTGTVVLSADVYGKSTVSATAVAAHEVGHAIQTAEGYFPSRLRKVMVPAVSFGSNIAWILIFIGLFANLFQLFYVGIAFFALAVLFQIVTLPVELNASSRAMTQLREGNMLSAGELSGARQVLTAAAFTYVAAALVSILQLLYFLGLGGRRN
jgi:Zn-dependent membrane protease YugP